MTTATENKKRAAKGGELKMLIDGKWTAAASGKSRAVIDPATAEVLARSPEAGAEDVDRAVAAARKAFEDRRWSGKTPAERSSVLWRLADKVEAELGRIAELERANCGKPDKLVRDGDIPFAVDNLRFFASVLRAQTGGGAGEFVPGYASVLRREPVGVAGLVAPWNYPFMMAVWKVAPALAAGNCAVFKPSELTPLTAVELGRLALEAGVPEGVLNVVLGSEEAGKALTAHPGVDMVSFTGDTETGRKIMAQAAPTVKRLHLELGGKAPFVVFADADLEAAVQGAVAGSTANAGQDCTAATRIYVERPVYDEFLKRYAAAMKTVRLGDPADRKTDMGPLISEEQRARVEGFVSRALKAGAKALCGGRRPPAKETSRGFYYEPTVLTDAAQGSEIVQDEVFGPVACVLPFKTEEEAVAKANDVRFGLAGSVWTKDGAKAQRMAARLRFGTVWINDHLPLCSEMPHGGFKASGFGKDMSVLALEEYTVAKHVMADTTGLARKPWHYCFFGQP